MTSQSAGHEVWEELAAAHALHALEPTDEQHFLAHLADCARCAAALDDYDLVAAQLGALADSEPDQVPSWSRIRAGIVDDGADVVVALEPRRRPMATRLLAAAAAVVTVTAVGVVGWQISTSDSSGPASGLSALSACEQQVGCRVIRLHASDGADPAAVLVHNGRATVAPLSLTTAPTGKTYVLWQMPRDGGPIPVSEFRQTNRETTAVALPTTYAETAAFAISTEPADTAPDRPTHVLAVGSAT
jgi:hypothetical protein